MSNLFVYERPEGLIGPFCAEHGAALQLANTEPKPLPFRSLSGADVAAYGDAMNDCKWCANPTRYEPPPIAASTDGRCETCKWWVVPTMFGPEHPRLPGRRTCLLAASLDYHPANIPGFPESKALASDDQDKGAELWTLPDFGCIQHSPREP